MNTILNPLSAQLSELETEIPDRNVWLLFKVGAHEHMAAMQRGLLYMNSVTYFARFEEEEPDALRGDPEEPLLARIRCGAQGKRYHQLILQIGKGEETKAFDVSENATLTAIVPSPENVMMFCFSALADDESGKIPGEANGELRLDARLLEFGTHIVIIRDSRALSHRINLAIQQHPNLYSSKYFQGGFGRVKYVDATGGPETLGLFRKARKYGWQQEFRFILGARPQSLNSSGALELEIGDISDITQLIPLESFLRTPINLKRRLFRKIGDQYIEAKS